jgi:hypothetical protein
MTDPIHVEQFFRNLIRELEETQSIHKQIRKILTFLKLLEGKYEFYESYLLQLAGILPQFRSSLSFTGIDPDELLEVLSHLEQAEKMVKSLSSFSHFRHSIKNYTICVTLMYIQLGEKEPVIKLINKYSGLDLSKLDINTEWSRIEDPVERLLFFQQSLQDRIAQKDEMPEFREFTSQMVQRKEGSVLLPVIEEYGTTGDGIPEFRGRLRRMSVRVTGTHDEAKDRLVRRFEIYGAEQPYKLDNLAAVKAARKLFEYLIDEQPNQTFRGVIDYELTGSYHHGSSYLAAIAALWFTAIQKFVGKRDRFEINPQIAITGSILEKADLEPVDDSGIRPKTEAAFFSWCPILIVPKSQLSDFNNELEKLKARYPNRSLKIIGIDNLKELFYDRRLTDHIRHSKIRHLAGKAWEKKFESAGVLTIIVLTVVIFRLIYGPLDRVPAISEFEGEFMNVRNQNGQLIEQIEVGEHTVRTALSSIQISLSVFQTENDRREIFWGETGSDLGTQRVNGTLNNKKILENENDWTVQLHYDLDFPNKPETLQGVYLPRKLLLHQSDENNSPDLVSVISHTPYFPGIISVRDSETGSEKSHFVNTGKIFDAIFIQSEETGETSIVFSGVNNAYDMSFLGILKPDSVYGHSPSTPEYELNGYRLNHSIEYVLIPKTIVGQSILSDRRYNIADRLRHFPDENVIEVIVTDYEQYVGDTVELPASRSYVYYYFNPDLSLRGVGTSDGYDQTAEYLYSNGLIEQYPDYEYFKNFQEQLQYWNGVEFVSYEEYSSAN